MNDADLVVRAQVAILRELRDEFLQAAASAHIGVDRYTRDECEWAAGICNRKANRLEARR